MSKVVFLLSLIFSLSTFAADLGASNQVEKSLGFYSSLWKCSNTQLFDLYLEKNQPDSKCKSILIGGRTSLSSFEYNNLLESHMKSRENIMNFISLLEKSAHINLLLEDVKKLMEQNITKERITSVTHLSSEQKRIIEVLYSQI